MTTLLHATEAGTRALQILDALQDGIVTTDPQGGLAYANPRALTLLGRPAVELMGRPLAETVMLQAETGPAGLARHALVVLHQNGSKVLVEPSVAPIRDGDGRPAGMVMVLREANAVPGFAHRLNWQETHDPLTGLINRSEFERRAAAVVARVRDIGEPACLCILDLDQFKIVNELCGHNAGDDLLRQISHLLLGQLRRTDTIARLGGDEFGLIFENCRPDEGEALAQHLLRTVQDWRFHWRDRVFTIGMSVGLVHVEDHFGDLPTLLSAADTVCFAAKENGRNRIECYEADDQSLLHRQGQMNWVERITTALDEGRFVLWNQTYRRLAGQGPQHSELLLRMIDAEGRVVTPDAFLPAAERYGLMPRIDRWVVSTAFSSLARLGDLGDHVWSINLSGQSLSSRDVFDFIAAEAAATGMAAQNVCFEITETSAITDIAHAAEFIRGLKALGFRFALDDFGIGMSSFGYLRVLPVDMIKIDGSFVRALGSDAVSEAMVRAVCEIARVMELKVVAEFVETDTILAKLVELGAHYAQGFAVARPAPLACGRTRQEAAP